MICACTSIIECRYIYIYTVHSITYLQSTDVYSIIYQHSILYIDSIHVLNVLLKYCIMLNIINYVLHQCVDSIVDTGKGGCVIILYQCWRRLKTVDGHSHPGIRKEKRLVAVSLASLGTEPEAGVRFCARHALPTQAMLITQHNLTVFDAKEGELDNMIITCLKESRSLDRPRYWDGSKRCDKIRNRRCQPSSLTLTRRLWCGCKAPTGPRMFGL